MQQPEIVRRMIAGKDLKAAGRAISKAILNNPKERLRRSQMARKVLKKYSRIGWIGRGFTGVHKPTKAESILLRMFPECLHNVHIATGKSAKLGYAHQYRLDVSWPKIKLVVELDGQYHLKPEQAKKDREKDSFLKGLGWNVLRFSNQEMVQDTARVKGVIESTILKLKAIQATL